MRKMTAKITFYPTNGEKSVVEFENLERAANVFREMYADYPTVIVLCGVPRPHFRKGPNGTIYLSDERGEIEMSRDGAFYLGATLVNSRHVRGMGYMAPMLDERTEDLLDEIPEDSIEGDQLHARAWIDPVRIGGLLVEQAEIDRVFRATGKLPGHVHHMDYSGSCMSVSEISWGDVPQILGLEVA